MEFKFSTQPDGNIIYKNTYADNFNGNGDIEEIENELRTENAVLHFKEKWFNGIHISIVEIDPNKTGYFLFESSCQHIGFLFCLNGAINYCCNHQQDNLFLLSKYEQNINAGKISAIRFSVTEKTKYIYIQLTETYFLKTTGREFGGNLSTRQQEQISPEISLILQHLLGHKYEGRIKRLFLEARIFELIIIYINQKQEKPTVTLKQEDIIKIMLAKQLVEQDIQKPNSLIELSRKAGINDYKLKKGFKELTGHTVFGYLYKIRMEKAHYFLSKEKRTVNEVAFLVGYKNAQHFIAAFKKQYHILPGSLNKN
jgi:AraC-like DNA-binding protein